jgi:hypothetical protein
MEGKKAVLGASSFFRFFFSDSFFERRRIISPDISSSSGSDAPHQPYAPACLPRLVLDSSWYGKVVSTALTFCAFGVVV